MLVVALVAQFASAGFSEAQQIAATTLHSLVKGSADGGRGLSGGGQIGAICESPCLRGGLLLGLTRAASDEETEKCHAILYGTDDGPERRLPGVSCVFDVCTRPAAMFLDPGQTTLSHCELVGGMSEDETVEHYRGLIRANGGGAIPDTAEAARCLSTWAASTCQLCTPECVGEDGVAYDAAAADLLCSQAEPEMADCSADCPADWLGDGECDAGCESADCDFDHGDCAAPGTTTTASTTTTAAATRTDRPALPDHYMELVCVKNPAKDAYCGDLFQGLGDVEALKETPSDTFPDTCAIECASEAAAAVMELGCCTASWLLMFDVWAASVATDAQMDADQLAMRALLATCGEPGDFASCADPAVSVQARLVFADVPAGAACEDVSVAGAQAAVAAQAFSLGAGPVDVWACEHQCGRRLRGGEQNGVLKVSMTAVADTDRDLDAEAEEAEGVLQQVRLAEEAERPEAESEEAESEEAEAEGAFSDPAVRAVVTGLAAAVAVAAVGCYALGRRWASCGKAPAAGPAPAPTVPLPVSPRNGPPPVAFKTVAAGPYPTPPTLVVAPTVARGAVSSPGGAAA